MARRAVTMVLMVVIVVVVFFDVVVVVLMPDDEDVRLRNQRSSGETGSASGTGTCQGVP